MTRESVNSDVIGSKLNRRAFLGLGWLAALGVLAARLLGVSSQFSIPRRKAGEYGGVFDLGLVRDLPPPGSNPIRYPKGRFWLVHTDTGLIALSTVCTHLDCLMDWDEGVSSFVCPCHGSQFDRDGTYIKGPAPRSLDRFVIQLLDDQGKTVAETAAETGAPLSLGGADGGTETESAAQAEASDSPFALFTVLVDTARKIPGRVAGDIMLR